MALMALVATPLHAQESAPRPVPELDLQRYAGLWYEISRYPNRFQQDCAGEVTATYTLRDDGRIDVLNRCRKASDEYMEARGIARLASPDAPASRLEVRFAPGFLSFLPFVWADYWVVDLAPDYSHAVVGHPERTYLWVLARAPEIDEEIYEGILRRVAAQGYDIDQLVETRQAR